MTKKPLKGAVERQNPGKPDACYEFAHLMVSMRVLGFRPADVARMLNKSQGAVSQYLSGYTQPSETVLALLRRLVVEKQGKQTSSEIGELGSKLACLKEFDNETYLILKGYIEKFYARATPLTALKASENFKSKNVDKRVVPIPHNKANEPSTPKRVPFRKNLLEAKTVRPVLKPSSES